MTAMYERESQKPDPGAQKRDNNVLHLGAAISETSWQIIILASSVAVILFSVYCLSHGITIIFMHLYYFPIVLLAYRYQYQGFALSIVLSIVYGGLVGYYDPGNTEVIIGALLRIIVFIGVAGVIAYLSHRLHHAMESLEEVVDVQESSLMNANVWLMVLDRKGNVLLWNKGAERISGYSTAEVTGSGEIWKLLYPDTPYRNEITKKIGKIIADDNFFEDLETTIRTRSGAKRVISWNTRRFTTPTGQDDRFIAIGINITDRKLAQEALRDSEAKYREFFTTSRDCVFITTPEGDWIDFNTTALEMFGYDNREELFAVPISSLYAHPDDRAPFLDRIEREGFVKEFPVRLQRKGGTVIDTLITTSPLMNKDGSIRAYIGTVRDITDRKRSEEALRESEARYSALFDNNYSVSLLIDPDTGRIVEANEAACWYYGFSREKLLTLGIYDLNHLPKEKVVQDLIRAKNERKKHFFSTHYLASGERRDVEIYSGPITLKGKPLFYSVIHDVTDQKRAEEALKMANKKLNLLGSITRHDISNQLMVHDGYLELLHEDVPDPALEVYFSRIASSSARIAAIIQFGKAYEQIGVRAPAWQDVRTIANEAARGVVWNEITYVNDLPEGHDVFADPLILTVFSNLMDNAVRHGDTISTIRFSSEKRGETLIVVCEDDGVGIPASEKEKIFDRGYGKNTGMGLFLSREILSITGITITENGEPGKGAHFEIGVPNGKWRQSVPSP